MEEFTMIYTENTKKAMKIAFNSHLGQADKGGMPYIYHPMHLAEQMETESECIVALLHDVVEDTPITFADLEKEFSEEVIDALKLITHDKSVDDFEYIRNLKHNKIARKVKLVDLYHNSNLSRLENITEKDKKRAERYKKEIEILNS